MKNTIKHLLALTLITGLFASIATGCNTTCGLGRDVRHVGSHIERAAN